MYENRLKQIINEELNTTEVRSMINSKLEDYLRERAFKKAVREIVVDVIEEYFREMWRKSGFWKNPLKNG